jgi:uncharacterized protein
MALISWILRILAVLLLVRLVLRFLGGVVRGYAAPSGSGPGPTRRSNQPATREGGHLVRDPQCGTYVPVARAIREGSGESAIYFCSDTCRHAWAAARKAG